MDDIDRNKLDFFCQSAYSRRRVSIHYRKYGGEESHRVVEPYQLQRNGVDLMVVCWQFHPDLGECDCWRNFRLDRIVSLGDGQSDFEPRRAIELDPETAREFSMDYQPGGSFSQMNEYYAFVQEAMKDGKFTAGERAQSEVMASRLAPHQVRAVHAQALRDVLQDCLMDGEISEAEAEYIGKVRRFLKRVGWVP